MMMRTFLLALTLTLLPTLAWAAGPLNPTRAQWIAPTTNTDTTPLIDLGSYKLYIATGVTPPVFPGTAWSVLATVPAALSNPAPNTIVTFTLPTISNGQQYLIVSAVDLAGNESAGSPVAPFLVDRLSPSAPGNLILLP